jgi:hypothetical protein
MPAGRKRKDRSILEGKCIQNLREAIKSPLSPRPLREMLAFFLRDVNLTCEEFVERRRPTRSGLRGSSLSICCA